MSNIRATMKSLFTKFSRAQQLDLAQLPLAILESWVANPDSASATSATTVIEMGETPLIIVNLISSTTVSFQNVKPGVYVFKLVQGGAGSHTITWPSNVKWAEASVPTLTTTAGAWDYITLVYDGEYFSAVPTLNFVV
jgi:hypothetical protein